MDKNSWKYKFKLSDEGIIIKDLLAQWYVPKYIRGILRQNKRLKINGVNIPTSYEVKNGDILEFELFPDDFENLQNYPANNDEQISVVFENEDYVLVNKIADQKMHPHSPNEFDTILNFTQAYFDKNNSTSYGMPAKAMMVHRLDRQTSGLVIIAKNPLAVNILNQYLFDKKIKRTYLAWVCGHIAEDSGIINAPIGIDPENNHKRIIDENGLPAITKWVKVHMVFQNTLVRINLESGRTNQIRVHFKSIGHPVVGDTLYNADTKYPRLLLHSATAEIPDLFSTTLKTHSHAAPIHEDFPRQLAK
jgi:23S rRNA pseudouridine1911/1915/1917 synthase